MMTEKFTMEEVAEALAKTGGLVTPAAALLGCDPKTVRNYMHRYPALAERMLEISEATLDLAEATLLQRIQKGDLTATIFYLKCKGKARGYVERQEIRGEVLAQVAHMTADDLKSLTDEQLREMSDGRTPRIESGGGT